MFGLLARGNNTLRIQEELAITKNTLKYHARHIYEKARGAQPAGAASTCCERGRPDRRALAFIRDNPVFFDVRPKIAIEATFRDDVGSPTPLPLQSARQERRCS